MEIHNSEMLDTINKVNVVHSFFITMDYLRLQPTTIRAWNAEWVHNGSAVWRIICKYGGIEGDE